MKKNIVLIIFLTTFSISFELLSKFENLIDNEKNLESGLQKYQSCYGYACNSHGTCWCISRRDI